MVAAAKATVPTITDQASAMQLSQCAKNLAAALAELRTAAQKVRGWVLSCSETLAVQSRGDSEIDPVVGRGLCHSRVGSAVAPLTFSSPPSQAQEACGPLEIDSALGLVQSLERDLQEAKAAARDGKLKPLPGETVRVWGRVMRVV